MAKRHTADTSQITFGQRETTIEIVRVQTSNLFAALGRAPTLREIATASGRYPSTVYYALGVLEKRGVVRMRKVGKMRRLEWCAGVQTSAERIVRKLADAGALAWSVEKALAAISAE